MAQALASQPLSVTTSSSAVINGQALTNGHGDHISPFNQSEADRANTDSSSSAAQTNSSIQEHNGWLNYIVIFVYF